MTRLGFCWSFLHSRPMIDALAHSLLCHLSVYLLTSKSFDLLMTLLQCKLSVCLHGFFFFCTFPYRHYSSHRRKKSSSCLAFSCICYAVDLAILSIGCVHFAPLVYVTDALFCMVVPRSSTWIPLCPDRALTGRFHARGWLLFVLALTSLSAFCATPQHYLSWPYLSPLCLSTFVCVGSFSRQARVEIALAVCSLSDLFVKRTVFIWKNRPKNTRRSSDRGEKWQ